jgi:hypothetical protein
MSKREQRAYLLLTLVVGVAGVIATLIATDTINLRAGGGTTTITEPPPTATNTPATPAPATVGLAALEDQQDVQFNVDAEFGTRNIAGTDYTDAVNGLVYGDGSAFDKLVIETKGRFNEMSFTVGIDSEAQCPAVPARVWIQDAQGATLWGPRTVGVASPATASIAIPSPVQVVLRQTSLRGVNACNNGEADVSWGGVTFRAS